MCIFYNVLSVRSLKIKIYIPLSVELMNKKRAECTRRIHYKGRNCCKPQIRGSDDSSRCLTGSSNYFPAISSSACYSLPLWGRARRRSSTAPNLRCLHSEERRERDGEREKFRWLGCFLRRSVSQHMGQIRVSFHPPAHAEEIKAMVAMTLFIVEFGHLWFNLLRLCAVTFPSLKNRNFHVKHSNDALHWGKYAYSSFFCWKTNQFVVCCEMCFMLQGGNPNLACLVIILSL